MKAEERKELQKNDLASALEKLMTGAKEGPSKNATMYLTLAIMGVALVVGLIYTWVLLFQPVQGRRCGPLGRTQSHQQRQRLDRQSRRVGEIRQGFQNAGTAQARLARFELARYYSQSDRELASPFRRPEALSNVKKARDLYRDLAKESADVPAQVQEALLGTAKASETIGDIDEARKYYEKVKKEYPQSVYGQDADRQLKPWRTIRTSKACAPCLMPRGRDHTSRPAISGTVLAGRAAVEFVAKIRVDSLRLDHYLVSVFPDYSRSVVQRIIENGGVTLNGRIAKASSKVRHDDRIRVIPPEPTHPLPVAENIPIEILFEDEFLAIVNKPANMVVHPSKGHWSGTLVNALRFHFDHLSKINGDYRTGIVHRLDRDTSGVIIVAKEEQTHRDMSLLFEQRKVFKEYVALAAGTLDRDSDYIEGRIAHHPNDRIKMTVTDDEEDEDAKDACSYYEVIERFRGYTFVRVQPRTGRTHQIECI